MAQREYTHNHYVPVWYQKRFLPDGANHFHYLDLAPEHINSDGHAYIRRPVRMLGPKNCFAEDNLYTTRWGVLENTDIEKFFFGAIDTSGREALTFFDNFEIRDGMHDAFNALVQYMSVQKLRTPKGLGWIENRLQLSDRNSVLLALQEIANMHCATWADCVWAIADASQCEVKFIVSDHPVTIYNRGCFPGSKFCKDFEDPDIRMVASQTIFPLSIDRILILTNLAWVRNPYQSERRLAPNTRLFRTTLFKGTDIQQGRALSDEEVWQINYIIKMRALRRIAAAEKDWLFPEEHLASTH